MDEIDVFWTDFPGAEAGCGRRAARAREHAAGRALLAWAVRKVWDIPLPEIAAAETGKPCFPAYPSLCFSVSHTRTAVLVALSACPVGADVEQRRRIGEAAARRLLTPDCGDLDLFELWTLRESYYKLTGVGSLRTLQFSRTGGRLCPPEPGIRCRLYTEIPGCAAAVCSRDETPPEHLQFVSWSAVRVPAAVG